jgi:hypothetical protein
MKNETVIRVENLAVSFGPRTIFKDVSFEVKRGEVFKRMRKDVLHCCKGLASCGNPARFSAI